MINSNMYEESIKFLSILRSERNVLQNIIYSLSNDLNVQMFLKDFIYKIDNFDNLKHMEKFYFEKDAEVFYNILNNLFYTFLNSPLLKEKTGEDIAKHCIIFSDSNGERAIRYFSYLPILKLFIERKKYLKAIEGVEIYKRDDNKDSSGFSCDFRKHQNEILFGKSFISKKFPDDDAFMDYDLKYEHSIKKQKEYEENKDDLQQSMNILISFFKKSDNIKNTEIEVGKTYYNSSLENKNKESKEFSKIFRTLLDNINED